MNIPLDELHRLPHQVSVVDFYRRFFTLFPYFQQPEKSGQGTGGDASRVENPPPWTPPLRDEDGAHAPPFPLNFEAVFRLGECEGLVARRPSNNRVAKNSLCQHPALRLCAITRSLLSTWQKDRHGVPRTLISCWEIWVA